MFSASTSLNTDVCEATTRLESLLNSITLNSADSPLTNLEPSSLTKYLEGIKAVMSSLNFTVAPLSTISKISNV